MNRERVQRTVTAAVVLVLASFLQTRPCDASLAAYGAHTGLKIHLTLDGSSAPPSGLDGDPVAALDTAMDEAKNQWESIFADVPSPGLDIDITYLWKSGTEGTTVLGTADAYVPAKTLKTGSEKYQIKFYTKWKESSGKITNIVWYLDSSVTGDQEEFAFQQTLYRDVAASSTLGGSPPDLMEMAYQGIASGAKAAGHVDLYTYALRQIGQTILECGTEASFTTGLSGSTTLSLDAYTSAFAPAGVSITCYGDNSTQASLMSWMRGTSDAVPLGERYLPSTLDIFLVAASRGFPVRLPHREMLAPFGTALVGPDLAASIDWLGGRSPDTTSDAFVRHSDIYGVELTHAASTRDLYVGWEDPSLFGGRREFRTGSNTLSLSDDLTITNPYTDFTVEVGGHVQAAGTVSVLEDGLLTMDRGILGASLIDVDSASEIYGNGTLQGSLINDGLIETDDSPLYFEGGLLDLDGIDDHGSIRAEQSDIHFIGIVPDSFGGNMYIKQLIELSQPLTLDQRGEVEFDNLGHQPLLQAPMTTVLEATVKVTQGQAKLDSPRMVFGDKSHVGATNAGASLDLSGNADFYNHPTFQGNGTIHQRGDVFVHSDAAVDILVATYNWDGENCGSGLPGIPTTTIDARASFHIVGSISACGDGYDGNVTIRGLLTVDGPWQLDGTMDLQGGRVTGGTVTNNKRIQGTGSIASFKNGAGCVAPDAVITYGAGSDSPTLCPK